MILKREREKKKKQEEEKEEREGRRTELVRLSVGNLLSFRR